MEQLRDRTVEWLTWMTVTAIFLTPALALVKALLPLPIPWGAVLIPWVGTIHLLLSWFAGQLIARALLWLFQTVSRS